MEGLAEADLITPIESDRAAPSILFPENDGTYRLVVDYRGLNKQIEKTCWPLPRINDVIDSFEGNMFFSSIDLTSGCFQMALKENSQNLHHPPSSPLWAFTNGCGYPWDLLLRQGLFRT